MMPVPPVSREELEQVRVALRIAAPLESASPLIQQTLAMIAHCWRGKVPANLWVAGKAGKAGDAGKAGAALPVQGQIDFKRRAAGDNE
ncbi:hypothetical protein [Undibacterium squillarum]|uniref:hypothetical protein n=1 Tax=Undibacterium squillarum TaxID=1131567 RepID=UPI0035B177DD